nr:P2X purinoceptor 7-like [Lytechinus pictus]
MEGPRPYDFEPQYSAEEIAQRAEERRRTGCSSERDNNGADVEPPPPPPDRLDNDNWCSCGNCRVMPTQIECICCHEIGNCRQFLSPSVNCIIDNEDFSKVCLERAVLRTALVARLDKRGHRGNLPRILENESYRYSAYRLFTYWIHGLLGRGVRKVIPSCAVLKIHSIYPAADGVYTGFSIGDDGEQQMVPEHFAI